MTNKTRIIIREFVSITLAVAMMFSMIFVAVPQKAYAATGNLLVNPGAEDGTLKGWTDASTEKCWMVGYKGSIKGWDHPAARTGNYYFMTGWPSESGKPRYLYQDVDITSYIGGKLLFQGYLGGWGHNDKGGIRLDILDASGKVIDSKASEMFAISYGDWSKLVQVSINIPSNAQKARVYLVGELNEGSEADAYFDDMSLTADGYTTPAPEPVSVKVDKVVISKITDKNPKHAHGIQVTWKKLKKNVTGYQLQASTAKNFKKLLLNKTMKARNNAWNIKANKGQKIYVRVRAYHTVNGQKVWGPWSKVKSKKAK